MTKIICPDKKCIHNKDGLCTREEVELYPPSIYERPQCSDYEYPPLAKVNMKAGDL